MRQEAAYLALLVDQQSGHFVAVMQTVIAMFPWPTAPDADMY